MSFSFMHHLPWDCDVYSCILDAFIFVGKFINFSITCNVVNNVSIFVVTFDCQNHIEVTLLILMNFLWQFSIHVASCPLASYLRHVVSLFSCHASIVACEFESKWKSLSIKMPRKGKSDNTMKQSVDTAHALLQHRQAALNRVKGSFSCNHLEIDWKLDPF